MGYTKGDLVRGALAELGIADYSFDIQPEEISFGIRRMNVMLAQWADKNILLSYSDGDDPDEESGIPSVALEAVITNLAIRLGPSYGKQPSGPLLASAKASMNTLLSTSARPRPKQFQLIPRGAGYKSADNEYIAPQKDRYIEKVDDEVDLSGGPSGT